MLSRDRNIQLTLYNYHMAYYSINEDEFRKLFSELFDKKIDDFFKKYYSVREHTKPEAENGLLNMKEAQEYLGFSRTTLWNWIKADKIISKEIRGKRFFDKEYLARFKRANLTWNERLVGYHDKHC
ncbi:MAG: helix-turn-helix domain-containing protein [Flavobacterium sp.]|nr:MAG: helix-turn-helix domain-containing protein [Flavobacterium sp.]